MLRSISPVLLLLLFDIQTPLRSDIFLFFYFFSQALACILCHLIQVRCFIPQEYPAGDDENKLGQQ